MTNPSPFGSAALRSRAARVVLILIAALFTGAAAVALPPLPDDFVNDETMLIGVIDLAQATPSAIDATGRGVLEHIPELGEYITNVRADYEPFFAAGARYIIFAAPEPRSEDVRAFLPAVGVFVDSDRSDEEVLRTILKKHTDKITSNPVIERHGDWLLLWDSERWRLIAPPADLPDLDIPGFDPVRCDRVRAAYAALSGRAIGATMIPTQRMIDEIEDGWETMPPEIQESPAAIPMLLGTAVQLHGWIDLGHNPAVTGVAELADAPRATRLAENIKGLPKLFMMSMEALEDEQLEAMAAEMEPEMALTLRVLRAISCVQQGSTVTVSIGQADLRPILDLAGPILEKQREEAKRYQVMSNSRQISMGLIMYCQDNNNQWPNSLDDLVTDGHISREQLDEMLTHPITGEKNAFKYVKPDRPFDELEDPATVPVLYELKNGAINKEGIIAYADGHVQVGEY